MPLEMMALKAAAIGARLAAGLVFTPFFGSLAIPMRIKALLVLLLTWLLYPLVRVPLQSVSPFVAMQLVLSEAALGLVTGLCLQFVFEAVQVAGQLAGFQLSFTLVNVIDPQTNVDTPVLANLHQLCVLLLYLQLNVHHWTLRALQASFDRVPPGSVTIRLQQVKALLSAAAAMWSVGLQLAAPLLLATVILDFTIGFISKAAPQSPALFLSIPMKIITGYVVLALALGLWPAFFEKQFAHALGWSWKVLECAK